MEDIVNENRKEIDDFIKELIQEISTVTFCMVILIIFIALMMSKYLSKKLKIF